MEFVSAVILSRGTLWMRGSIYVRGESILLMFVVIGRAIPIGPDGIRITAWLNFGSFVVRLIRMLSAYVKKNTTVFQSF